MTMLLLKGNRFNVPYGPKWWKKGKAATSYSVCVLVMAAASYFFLEIVYKCCKVQQACKEERVGTDPCLLSVEIAVRITG